MRTFLGFPNLEKIPVLSMVKNQMKLVELIKINCVAGSKIKDDRYHTSLSFAVNKPCCHKLKKPRIEHEKN